MLYYIVHEPTIIKDFKYLTGFKHSGELEVFHSLYNVYCPKRLSYSYESMYARTQLAVLDHNSGVGREHAKTKSGEHRYKVTYSKISADWVAKKIMAQKDKTFLKDILSSIWEVSKSPQIEIEKTPKNLATIDNPGKEAVIQRHVSRFTS